VSEIQIQEQSKIFSIKRYVAKTDCKLPFTPTLACDIYQAWRRSLL